MATKTLSGRPRVRVLSGRASPRPGTSGISVGMPEPSRTRSRQRSGGRPTGLVLVTAGGRPGRIRAPAGGARRSPRSREAEIPPGLAAGHRSPSCPRPTGNRSWRTPRGTSPPPVSSPPSEHMPAHVAACRFASRVHVGGYNTLCRDSGRFERPAVVVAACQPSTRAARPAELRSTGAGTLAEMIRHPDELAERRPAPLKAVAET